MGQLFATRAPNQLIQILPPAARAATTTSPAFYVPLGSALLVVVNVFVSPGGAQTLQLQLRGIALGVPIGNAFMTGTTLNAAVAGDTIASSVGPNLTAAWTGITFSGAASALRTSACAQYCLATVRHSGAGVWNYDAWMLVTGSGK